MRLTIIPDDSFVAVDGDSSHRPLDLSTCNIPQDVHALQWFETKGWIEFDDPVDPFSPKPLNEEINALPEWALACAGVWEEWTPPTPNNQPLTTGVQSA